MNATLLSEFRQILLEERVRILAEWENHGGDGGAGVGWNSRNSEDRASEIPYETVDRSIAGHDLNLLRKIDLALLRIDDGTYSQCAECGGVIPLERLRAKPSVSLCLACQEERDAAKV